MELSVVTGDITAQAVQAIVVNLFEGVESPGGGTGAVDSVLGGAISSLIAAGEIKGTRGEITVIHTIGDAYSGFVPDRVIVAGLGKAENLDLDGVRSVSAIVARRLRRLNVENAATIVHGAGIGGLDPEACAEALGEGAILGLYRFDKYRTSSKPKFDETRPATLTLVENDASKVPALEAGVARGQVFAGASIAARDMVSEPANVLHPTKLAEIATDIASAGGMAIKVLERSDCEALEMGAYVGVSLGSHQPPKFIHMTYDGDPANPDNNLWIIGKGITFDSGGISLKGGAGMGAMKGDMSGGAAAIASMQAIATLKPVLNVHMVCAATENMPGGGAQRPGDVVIAMGGKSIEVDNTDAEGRLTLADAIGFARTKGAARIVDIATLTGAMVVALGMGHSGAFSNDDELVEQVIAAGDTRGEPIWRMPLDPITKKQNRSDIADLKNSGGRGAGSITAAHFIGEFAGDTPWVHLDIAATNMGRSVHDWEPNGATGVPTRALIQLALDLGT
ncbi:MAG: leucyl aminopeptidase [Dehalococcoidia bacterium]|jgi:leucyl aminopeptidase|nr:leucyl aminopeptidase [Dehalococcoidia bacterium]